LRIHPTLGHAKLQFRTAFPSSLAVDSEPQFFRMERAARLIKKDKLSRQVFTDDDLARAIWPAAVGKAIAAHTLRVRLVRSTLVVEVEDAIWQRQLHSLSRQIVGNLQKLMGSQTIADVEFRVGVPRRQPGRAESLSPSRDEADDIHDPMLKKVYQLSRKKAIG
jgi:Dna[CI] antecedent, DciA